MQTDEQVAHPLARLLSDMPQNWMSELMNVHLSRSEWMVMFMSSKGLAAAVVRHVNVVQHKDDFRAVSKCKRRSQPWPPVRRLQYTLLSKLVTLAGSTCADVKLEIMWERSQISSDLTPHVIEITLNRVELGDELFSHLHFHSLRKLQKLCICNCTVQKMRTSRISSDPAAPDWLSALPPAEKVCLWMWASQPRRLCKDDYDTGEQMSCKHIKDWAALELLKDHISEFRLGNTHEEQDAHAGHFPTQIRQCTRLKRVQVCGLLTRQLWGVVRTAQSVDTLVVEKVNLNPGYTYNLGSADSELEYMEDWPGRTLKRCQKSNFKCLEVTAGIDVMDLHWLPLESIPVIRIHGHIAPEQRPPDPKAVIRVSGHPGLQLIQDVNGCFRIQDVAEEPCMQQLLNKMQVSNHALASTCLHTIGSEEQADGRAQTSAVNIVQCTCPNGSTSETSASISASAHTAFLPNGCSSRSMQTPASHLNNLSRHVQLNTIPQQTHFDTGTGKVARPALQHAGTCSGSMSSEVVFAPICKVLQLRGCAVAEVPEDLARCIETLLIAPVRLTTSHLHKLGIVRMSRLRCLQVMRQCLSAETTQADLDAVNAISYAIADGALPALTTIEVLGHDCRVASGMRSRYVAPRGSLKYFLNTLAGALGDRVTCIRQESNVEMMADMGAWPRLESYIVAGREMMMAGE